MQLVALSVLASTLLWTAVRAQGAEDEYEDRDIEEETLSDDQMRSLHGKFDKDGNGKVSFDEVMAFAHEMSKSIASRDIQPILEEIDVSPKDGRLSLEEHITDVHNQAEGEGADEEDQKQLVNRKRAEADKFRAADMNGDGHLDAHEVVFLFYPETNEQVMKVAVQETMGQKDKNGDGVLSPHEFWEADVMDGDDGQLSQEELQDFGKLDINGDGFVDMDELQSWESGRFHTEEAMKKLFELADENSDMHISAAEFIKAKEPISASDAQFHLMDWSEHNEL